jgi:hypothetical protein
MGWWCIFLCWQLCVCQYEAVSMIALVNRHMSISLDQRPTTKLMIHTLIHALLATMNRHLRRCEKQLIGSACFPLCSDVMPTFRILWEAASWSGPSVTVLSPLMSAPHTEGHTLVIYRQVGPEYRIICKVQCLCFLLMVLILYPPSINDYFF